MERSVPECEVPVLIDDMGSLLPKRVFSQKTHSDVRGPGQKEDANPLFKNSQFRDGSVSALNQVLGKWAPRAGPECSPMKQEVGLRAQEDSEP